MTTKTAKTQTYMVEARLGDRYEYFYVAARTAHAAIARARFLAKGTAMDHPFTNFSL